MISHDGPRIAAAAMEVESGRSCSNTCCARAAARSISDCVPAFDFSYAWAVKPNKVGLLGI